MSTITTSIIRPSTVTLSPSSTITHKRDPAHITLEIAYPTATNSLGEPSPRLGFAFIDRDSAIALGVILILVLASVGWYFYLRISNSRQDDLERLAGADRRASFGQPALRSYGSRGRAAEAQFRTHRLWSRNSRSVPRSTPSRSISGSTLRGSIKSSIRKLSMAWPASRTSSGASSEMTQVESVNQPSRSRSPSPHSIARTHSVGGDGLSTGSHHRRQSSMHSMPDPLLEELQPARRSSSWQARQDRQWWNDVGRRGSTGHADRRFSVLEPILEPDASDEMPPRAFSYAGEHRRRMSRAARRSNSSYNWSRPAVGHVAGREGSAGRSGFSGIVWADEQGGDLEGYGSASPPSGDEGETVEGKDWATSKEET